MTAHDDELKDLFRQKHLENDFLPDEQNWEKMAAVLKAEKEKKRRGFIYLSILFILLGSASVWFLNKPAAERKEQRVFHKSSSPEKAKTLSSPAQHSLAQANKKSPVISPSKSSVAVTANKKESKTRLAKEEPLPSVATADSEMKDPLNVPQISTMASSALDEELPDKVEETVSKQIPVNVSVQTSKKDADRVASADDSDGELSDVSNDKRLSDTGTLTVNKAAYVNPVTAAEQNIGNKNASDTAARITSSELTTLPLAEPAMGDVPEKSDSSAVPEVLAVDSLPAESPSLHKIMAEAGINYMLGWQTNNTREAAGINPLFALRYQYQLSEKSAFSAGLCYTTINYLSQTSHTSTTTRLKFGEEVDVTVVSARRIHYLLLPLRFSYALSKNDAIGLGYTFAYLLDAESQIETYSKGMYHSSESVVSEARGYTKGLQAYDGQLVLCYTRRVYKACYLNAEVFYGLRDVKENSIYTTPSFERACGLRISLGFDLWKK
jgi:hypothetical protein